MRPSILTAFLILFLNPFLQASEFTWDTTTPEAQGFSVEGLKDLTAELDKLGTNSLLVIRNGKIVNEWYAEGWDRNRNHYSASLAKSLVGGLSLMLALDDGKIVLDAPACRYIPEWRADSKKAVITIRQLATHTSGMEDAEITRLKNCQESQEKRHQDRTPPHGSPGMERPVLAERPRPILSVPRPGPDR